MSWIKNWIKAVGVVLVAPAVGAVLLAIAIIVSAIAWLCGMDYSLNIKGEPRRYRWIRRIA